MKNLAGNLDCDKYIEEELSLAHVPFRQNECFRNNSEVPTSVIGTLNGWNFRRAWYYWVVSSNDNLLLFENADKLHAEFGDSVRVGGHCGCPAPREWYNNNWSLGVNLYHVDTQEGLNALVVAIINQTEIE